MPSPRYWREIPTRLRLEAARCDACGRVDYPARRVCSACRGAELSTLPLSRKGTVVTYTVIHVAPTDFAMEAPYAMAIVETPEKARLMMQVADCDPSEVCSGMPVEFEFRRIHLSGGRPNYYWKATPQAGE
jgi:uncharacterized OB-fold protein